MAVTNKAPNRERASTGKHRDVLHTQHSGLDATQGRTFPEAEPGGGPRPRVLKPRCTEAVFPVTDLAFTHEPC